MFNDEGATLGQAAEVSARLGELLDRPSGLAGASFLPSRGRVDPRRGLGTGERRQDREEQRNQETTLHVTPPRDQVYQRGRTGNHDDKWRAGSSAARRV